MTNEEKFLGVNRLGKGYFADLEPAPGIVFPDEPGRDTWLAWAVALSYAKRGDFRFIRQLPALYDPASNDYRFNYQCASLIGDAGPSSCFATLIDELKNPSNPIDYEVAINFSFAVSVRGRLGDVPLILDTFVRHASVEDAEIIPVYISDMFSKRDGDFPMPEHSPSVEHYVHVINDRYHKLLDETGDENVFVFHGQIISVIRLAEYILKAVRTPYFAPELRQRFEASTGVSCVEFYGASDRLQPLNAAAIIEEFLHGPDASNYEDGTRYFFGYKIPE